MGNRCNSSGTSEQLFQVGKGGPILDATDPVTVHITNAGGAAAAMRVGFVRVASPGALGVTISAGGITVNRNQTMQDKDGIIALTSDIPTVPTLGSGTYSPTLTNATNLSAATLLRAQWLRVGDIVTVSGAATADAVSAANTITVLGVSLPVASSFTNSGDCAGAGQFSQGTSSAACGVQADAANNRASVVWASPSTAIGGLTFTFTYRVQ